MPPPQAPSIPLRFVKSQPSLRSLQKQLQSGSPRFQDADISRHPPAQLPEPAMPPLNRCRPLLFLLLALPALSLAQLSQSTLACYQCSETLVTKGRPYDSNSTCRYLYDIKGAYCMADQIYCKSEYVTVFNVFKTFVRSCSDKCDQGCQATGWKLTATKCTQCCRTSFCNTENGNTRLAASAILLDFKCALCVLVSLLTLTQPR